MTSSAPAVSRSNAPSEAPPRFASILVARSNTARPSELEVSMRPHCRKMKVSTRLSGAHMILQSTDSNTSVAVRCYYPFDLERLTPARTTAQQQEIKDNLLAVSHVDGLPAFIQHFQWTATFFVLPDDIQKAQMRDKDSFLRQAMRLLDDFSLQQPGGTDNPRRSMPNKTAPTTSKKNPPRIVVVSNTQQAVNYLLHLTEALKPHKHKLRHEFFQRRQIDLQDVTTRAVTGFRQLADRLGLPPGETDILMRVLGPTKLSSIAAADEQKLQGVPIDDKSKQALQQFFQTKKQSVETVSDPLGALNTVLPHGNSHGQTTMPVQQTQIPQQSEWLGAQGQQFYPSDKYYQPERPVMQPSNYSQWAEAPLTSQGQHNYQWTANTQPQNQVGYSPYAGPAPALQSHQWSSEALRTTGGGYAGMQNHRSMPPPYGHSNDFRSQYGYPGATSSMQQQQQQQSPTHSAPWGAPLPQQPQYHGGQPSFVNSMHNRAAPGYPYNGRHNGI